MYRKSVHEHFCYVLLKVFCVQGMANYSVQQVKDSWWTLWLIRIEYFLKVICDVCFIGFFPLFNRSLVNYLYTTK